MVFANGKNDLEPFIYRDMNELEVVGSTPEINVVAQFGSMTHDKVVRFRAVRDQNLKRLTSPIMQDMGKLDMGDWRQVVEFVRWAATNFPAKRYFLAIADHGSGWRGDGDPKTLSHDFITGNAMSNHQIALALGHAQKLIGRPIDVYGSDACLMAMVEVAASAYGAASYFVGSQELEPAEGWPYDRLLAYWNQNSRMLTKGVVRNLTRLYAQSYYAKKDGANERITFSGYDIAALPAVAQGMRSLSQQLLKLPQSERSRVRAAMDLAQRFTERDYADLIDLIYRLEELKLASIPPTWLAQLRNAVNLAVIANVRSRHYPRAFGLSIWLPVSTDRGTFDFYQNLYRNQRFNRVTGWGEVLNAYIVAGAAPPPVAPLDPNDPLLGRRPGSIYSRSQ